jgi:hypothetical protein
MHTISPKRCRSRQYEGMTKRMKRVISSKY